MPIVKVTNNTGPDLDEGVYRAIVDSVEEVENKFGDQPKIAITYRLLDETRDNGNPITVRQWVTASEHCGPKSKLYEVLSATLCDGELLEDGEIDTDKIVGKSCQLWWGSYTTKDGKPGMGVIRITPRAKAKKGGANRRQELEEELDNL